MILNIINSVKEHNTEKTWFDTNGAAGLVFYFALAAVIVLYMSGNALPATIVLTVLFIIPLLLMFFKEPLSAMIEKKAQKMEGGVGMFITQGVFELFEVLLSYFSTTLSFVRVEMCIRDRDTSCEVCKTALKRKTDSQCRGT